MTEISQKKYLPEGSLLGSITNFEYLSSQRGLERAIADGVILEAIATSCDSARDLTVDLKGYSHNFARRQGSLLQGTCHMRGRKRQAIRTSFA